VRTTLTLDDDVASKLESEVRRSGKSYRDVVNDALRRGLASPREGTARTPFKVVARGLGRLKPGIAIDSTSDLLEQVEGPGHR